MRLLPRDPIVGWTPYVWLIYTAFYIAFWLVVPTPAWTWPVHAVGFLAFLAVYFRAFWVDGRARLPLIVAIVALGAALTPLNPGALVFFIFAASFVGGALTGRVAAVWIVAIAVLGVVAGWLSGWWHPALLVSVAVMTPVIGFVNLHASEVRRHDATLRMANDEIARLAARQERDRIAADLHDLLGHTLSVIVLKSELASKLLARDPARAAGEVREVERISRDALAEVRAAVQGFRVTTVAEEIARARKVLGDAGVTVEVASGADVADPRVNHTLGMIVREAVTNVLRHSKAATCRVTMRASNGETILEIADDGAGGTIREGSGLLGMRARAREIGGTLDVDATRGVTVTVRVPTS